MSTLSIIIWWSCCDWEGFGYCLCYWYIQGCWSGQFLESDVLDVVHKPRGRALSEHGRLRGTKISTEPCDTNNSNKEDKNGGAELAAVILKGQGRIWTLINLDFCTELEFWTDLSCLWSFFMPYFIMVGFIMVEFGRLRKRRLVESSQYEHFILLEDIRKEISCTFSASLKMKQ